jgi:hypothetical protein
MTDHLDRVSRELNAFVVRHPGFFDDQDRGGIAVSAVRERFSKRSEMGYERPAPSSHHLSVAKS